MEGNLPPVRGQRCCMPWWGGAGRTKERGAECWKSEKPPRPSSGVTRHRGWGSLSQLKKKECLGKFNKYCLYSFLSQAYVSPHSSVSFFWPQPSFSPVSESPWLDYTQVGEEHSVKGIRERSEEWVATRITCVTNPRVPWRSSRDRKERLMTVRWQPQF